MQLLLQHGASITDLDNEGNSVMNDVAKELWFQTKKEELLYVMLSLHLSKGSAHTRLKYYRKQSA